MLVTLTIVRYRKRFIPFALLAMAIHRLPLWLNNKISFYKLLGCGRNGSFDIHPDWQQWGILSVNNSFTSTVCVEKDLLKKLYGIFIAGWYRFFRCETCTFLLLPVEGHGKWDQQEPFGNLPKQTTYDGVIAVLTRATIRISKLPAFWRNVNDVAVQMDGAKGFISSIGIGEMPLFKQATFSLWRDKESMKNFAYQMAAHTTVIKKTRKEDWYSEDMFVRFKPIRVTGTIRGVNPLEGIL